ncbi:putative methanogenesis marker protein 8 [Methanomicrobium sp. W14]|uniref:methanogenesis marker 8 protein n=1 Tax=Methanomicrobium sp. W14 TaxID=2817839 RepID=UPI001AE79352|nr:methanogenesis marker 8 protein [Methanomicrobium sp. W14]MBP2132291.1 putative methanogenesis marker protein 8 [Methanomicrobium sp. W14]
MNFTDEHIIEAAGKARVVVRNGKVFSAGKPLLSQCPLAERFNYPVRNMSPDEIKKNIEERISSFGMCTREREVLSDDDFVLFGASELLKCAVENKIIDCAVIACDGAGTVISKNPRLIQGIGGKMSGLIKTCPYTEVIDRINENGGFVPFPDDAGIDPYKGYIKADKLGFSNVAVTVASGSDALKIKSENPKTVVIGVHTTGANQKEAELLSENCDIISACASQNVRNTAGKKALLQGGATVPVYAMTQKGKEIILEKIRCTSSQVLVKSEKLPVSSQKTPGPLI